MPNASTNVTEEELRSLKQQAMDAGFGSLGAYVRHKLGLPPRTRHHKKRIRLWERPEGWNPPGSS